MTAGVKPPEFSATHFKVKPDFSPIPSIRDSAKLYYAKASYSRRRYNGNGKAPDFVEYTILSFAEGITWANEARGVFHFLGIAAPRSAG